MTTHSPVSNIRIAEQTDSANANTLAGNLAADIDHLLVPKYANSTARDAANPTPTTGDHCFVGTTQYHFYINSGWKIWTMGTAGPDATSSTKGITQLAGDLMGTAAAPYSKGRSNTWTVGPAGTNGADYICDGTADEVEINAAITAANAAGGGTVKLRAGTFVLSDSIVPKGKVHLRGEGMFATKITPTSGQRSGMLGQTSSPPTGFQVSDMEFDGTNFVRDGLHFYKAIYGDSWTDCKIYNLYVHDTTATGIGVDGMYRCTIDKCIVKTCGTYGTIGNNGIGIATGSRATESWIVSNCLCISNANNNYLAEMDNVNGTDEAIYIFQNNISIKAGTAGFRNSGTNNVSFLGNQSYYSGQNSTAGCAEIYISPASTFHAENNIVSNNHCAGSLFYGILIPEESKNTIVSNNVVRNCVAQGIVGWGDNLQITGNTIFKNGHHGISVGPPNGGAAHKSVIISNNHVYNNAQVTANTDAIYITGQFNTLTDVHCVNNRCYDDQGTQTQRGIRVETPGGTYTGIIIKDNNCDSNKSFAYSLGTTVGLIFKNNYGGTGATRTGSNPEILQAVGNITGATTLDLSKGNLMTATLTGNVTAFTVGGAMVPGDEVTLILTQDGTGSRTLARGATFKAAGNVLTLSVAAGAIDIITAVWNGAAWVETGRALAVA